MGDMDFWTMIVGSLAAIFLGLPARGFLGYWLMALLRFGWDVAAMI